MTPLMLQDALVEDMQALLGNMQLGSGGTFKVHAQALEPRKEEKDYSMFPFCRVFLDDGEDGEEAAQDVAIVLAVRDPNPNMQGYRDVMNAVERIRQHLKRNPVVAGRFCIKEPIRWVTPDGETYPYYYGAVLLRVELPAIAAYNEYT